MLRDFGVGVRLGLTLLAIVVIGGSAVSGIYLREHHAGRDEREGFTTDDIRAHYHGMRFKSPMLVAIKDKQHPEDLDPELRAALIEWLEGDAIMQNYANMELGDKQPAEIIRANCVSCHDADALDLEAYPELPLRYPNQVQKVAMARDIMPVDEKVLLASLHAHALGLASLCMITVLLLALTRAPSAVKGMLAVLIGGGLLLDLGAWIPARDYEFLIWAIMGGGVAFQAGTTLSLLVVLLDLWLPRRTPSTGSSA